MCDHDYHCEYFDKDVTDRYCRMCSFYLCDRGFVRGNIGLQDSR